MHARGKASLSERLRFTQTHSWWPLREVILGPRIRLAVAAWPKVRLRIVEPQSEVASKLTADDALRVEARCDQTWPAYFVQTRFGRAPNRVSGASRSVGTRPSATLAHHALKPARAADRNALPAFGYSTGINTGWPPGPPSGGSYGRQKVPTRRNSSHPQELKSPHPW